MSQESAPQVWRAAMLAAFQSLAIVTLSAPLHSIVSSVTEQFVKSGPIESSRVSVAKRIEELAQSSVAVYVTVIVPPAPQVLIRFVKL